MSRVVWKYAIPDGEGEFGLDVPEGWRLAHVGVQENEPFLWLEVWPDQPIRRHRFFARDTGQVLDDADYRGSAEFLGTYETRLLALGGVLVRHVWAERS